VKEQQVKQQRQQQQQQWQSISCDCWAAWLQQEDSRNSTAFNYICVHWHVQ
jgi:hypothetical protein